MSKNRKNSILYTDATEEQLLNSNQNNTSPTLDFIDFNKKETRDLLDLDNVVTPILSGAFNLPNLSELNRLTNGNYVTNDDNNYRLAATQPISEQLSNYLPKAAYNFASGFVSNFNYDIKGMIDMWNGVERDYSNVIFNTAENLRKKGEEYPIYQEGNSFSDPAYWLNQVSNATFSFGLAAGTFLEQGVLTGLTTTTGGATSGVQGAKFLQSVSKFINNPATKSVVTGTAKGIQEGFMNGYETAQNTYKIYKDYGYSEEDALKKASEAAALAYKMEVGPLIVLNTLQLATVGSKNPFKEVKSPNLGYSGAIETLTDGLNIKNKTVKSAFDLALNMVSESGEEVIQGGISDYATHQSLSKDNLRVFNDFEFFTDKRLDEAVGGALGGSGFHIIGKALNKFTDSKNPEGDVKDVFLKAAAKNTEKNLKIIEEAVTSKDSSKIDLAKYQANKDNVLQSLLADFINKSETSFEVYTNNLKERLDAINTNDAETLKNLNINTKEDIDFIKNNYNSFLEDANFAKKSFIENYEKIEDADIALKMTDSQLVLKHTLEKQKTLSSDINNIFNKNEIYNLLSTDAQNKFKLETEKFSFRVLEEVEKTPLTKEQKERLKTVENQLEEIKISDKENNILLSLSKKDFIQPFIVYEQLEQIKGEAVKNLALYQSSKYPQERILERIKHNIENSTNIENLTSFEKEAKNKGIFKEVEETLIKKRKELSLKELTKQKEQETQQKQKQGNKFFEDFDSADYKEFAFFMSEEEVGEIPLENEEKLNKTTEDLKEGNVEDILPSRKNITGNKFVPETLLNSAKNYFDGFVNSPFEKIVEDIIKTRGVIKAEDMFDGIAFLYSKIYSEPIVDKEQIYNKYFNAKDVFLKDFDIFNESLLITEQEAINIGENYEKSFEKEITNDTIASSGNIDKKTPKGVLKFAYNFEDSQKNEITGQYTLLSNSLKKLDDNDAIDNYFILDSDFLYQIDIESKQNPSVLKIQQIDDESLKLGGTTWGALKQSSKEKVENNIWTKEEYDSWFIQKVPVVVVYEGNLTTSKVVLSMVHSTDWYATGISDRNEQTKKEEIYRGSKDTYDIRLKISEQQSKSLPISLLNATNTGWIKSTVFNQIPIPISQATGESVLAIIDSNSTNGYDIVLPSGAKIDKTSVIKYKEVKVGDVVDIRRLGTNEKGEPTYIMLPVLNDSPLASGNLSKNLNPDIYNTLKYAILAATLLTNKDNQNLLISLKKEYNIDLDKAQKIVNSIKKDFGYDISKGELPKFINVFNNTRSNPQKKLDGIVYINSNEDRTSKTFGSISFETKNNFQIIVGNNYEGDSSKILKNLDMLFGKQNLLNNILLRYNIKETRNDSITLFSQEGDLVQETKSYEDIMKRAYKTIFLSHQIETINGEKKWITNIQPRIEFSVSENISVSSEDKTIIEETPKTQENNLRDLILNSSLSEEEKLIALSQIQETDVIESRLNITQVQKEIISQLGSSIEGISFQEITEITDNIVHNYFQEIDLTANISPNISDIIDKILTSKKNNFTNLINFYTNLNNEKYRKENELLLQKIEKLLTQKNILLEQTQKKIYTFFDINAENTKENENFIESFLEKNPKLKFNTKLRTFFYGFEKKNSTGNIYLNSLGFPLYESPDYIYDVLTDISTTTPSNWNILIKSLKGRHIKNIGGQDKIVGREIFSKIANKLEKLPEDMRNEILFKIHLKRNIYIKPLISGGNPIGYYDTTTGLPVTKEALGASDKPSNNPLNWEVTILDENSSKAETIIKNTYLTNVNHFSSFFLRNEESKLINISLIKNLIKDFDLFEKDYNNLTEKEKIKTLSNLFKAIGLGHISLNTIEVIIREQNFLDNKNTLFGKVGLLYLYKNKILSSLADNKIPDFLNEINTPLTYLVNKEVELNGSFTPKSVYINGATLQGISANTLVFDITQNIVNSEETLNFLLQSPNTQNNYILDLIKTSEKIKDTFKELYWISKNSLKIHGKKFSENVEFDNSTLIENFITQFSLFTNTKGTSLTEDTGLYKRNKSLSFRIGFMGLGITLSDKGRMVIRRLPLLKLKEKNIVIEEDNTISFSEETLDFIFEQTFLSELNRIKQSYEQSHNVKDYNKVSKIFHTIPAFNGIKINHKNTELTVGEILASNNGVLLENTKEQIYKKAKELIVSYLNQEVDNKLSKDGKKGQLVDNDIFNPNTPHAANTKYLSTDYLNNSFGVNKQQKIRTALMEFIVNNLLTTMFTTEVYLGGISYYGNSKSIPLNPNGNIDFTKLSEKENYETIAKNTAANLQKRAALLIAPGLKYADSDNPLSPYPQEFLHIALEDVKTDSNIIESLMREEYGDSNENVNKALVSLKTLTDKIKKTTNPQERNKLNKELKDLKNKSFPEIIKYFDIEGTDAQEYTTWREHLQALLRQGVISRVQFEIFAKKITNNEDLDENELNIIYNVNIGQPEKDVYTGVLQDTKNNVSRPVYIKSSAFPLLPQVTKNLKLDKIRSLLEKLEANKNANIKNNLDEATEDKVTVLKNGTYVYYKKTENGYIVDNNIKIPVRASYQTANKIGATSDPIKLEKVYNNNIGSLEIEAATTILPYKFLRLQQETPSKELIAFKKQKDSYITMGSQPFKQFLGNFINIIKEDIFDNIFSDFAKNTSGVNKNKINGEELEKIALEIYNNYSQMVMEDLLEEIGFESDISFNSMDITQKGKVIKNLQKIIQKEVEGRDFVEYLKDSINLIEENGELKIESSLLFDNNRYKFESLLQSLVANRLIKHKLPGNQHILGSSEGFEKITFEDMSEASKETIVWVGEFKDALKSNYIKTENGGEVLYEAEAIISAHWSYFDEDGVMKYVDLSEIYDEENQTGYSKPILNGKGVVVGYELVTERIDKELLSNFTFRTPWSSHQSGTNIKIVGFLPNSMQDLFVTSKDFLVQIGEDFDIDKRNIYKNNYYIDPETKAIKVLNTSYIEDKMNQPNMLSFEETLEMIYDDLGVLGDSWRDLQKELTDISKELNEKEQFKIKFAHDKFLQKILMYDEDILTEELEGLLGVFNEKFLEKKSIEESEEQLFNLRREILNGSRKLITDKWKQKIKRKSYIKLLENDIINVFKSVYSTPNNEVRKKIFKPLSTDFTKRTGNVIKNISKNDGASKIFSLYSDSFQASLIENGNSGKIGTAYYSLAVIFEAQLQRMSEKIVLTEEVFDGVSLRAQPFSITFGEGRNAIEINNILGSSSKTVDKLRDIVDVHAENQNRAVDNVKEQTMQEINENSDTIPIYSLLGHLGVDATPIEVEFFENGEKKKEKLSFSALFMSQPIIKDYVDLLRRNNGILSDFISQQEKEQYIVNILSLKYNFSDFNKLEDTKIITGQGLVDNLSEGLSNNRFQKAVLQSFLRLKKASEKLSKYRQLINFSESSIGVSYFNTVEHINLLNEIAKEHFTFIDTTGESNNVPKLIGEVSEEPLLGYTQLGNYYWKPTTLEGIMVVNALKTSNQILPVFFPYNSNFISDIISNIFTNKGNDINKVTKTNTELKYDIMTELTNFFNSSFGLFEGNLEDEINRIFESDSNNTSLGDILLYLKNINHPVMSTPFLKDLTFKKDSNITQILHTSEEDVLFSSSDKSEILLQMLLDNNSLLHKGESITFNGEVMTLSKIAQDLVSYAYLSNDGNGAIGFKKHIPAKYLSKIKVFDKQRLIFEAINQNKDYVEIDGITYSMQELQEKFITQFYQHNPDKALVLKENIFDEYIKNPKMDRPYISVRRKGKWVLYKLDNEIGNYKEIKIFPENQPYKSYNLKNNVQKEDIKGIEKKSTENNRYIIHNGNRYDVKLIEKAFIEKDVYQKVNTILTSFFNSKDTIKEHKKIIEEILPYIDNDIKIIWDYSAKQDIAYNRNNKTIIIRPNILETFTNNENGDYIKAKNNFKEAFIEEVIHSITVGQIDKYLESSSLETGDIKVKDNAPIHIWKIVKAYETARKAIPFNGADRDSFLKTYFSKNIYEFIHGYFTNEQYREDIEKAEPGFKEKFFDAIVQMFKHLKSVLTGKYPDHKEEIFDSIRTLFKENKKEQSIKEQNNKQMSFEDIGEKEFSRPLDNLSIPITRNVQTDEKQTFEETTVSNTQNTNSIYLQLGNSKPPTNIESRFNLKTNQLPNIHKCK